MKLKNIIRELRYVDIGSRDGIDPNFQKLKKYLRYTAFDPGSDIINNSTNTDFLQLEVINKAVYKERKKLPLNVTRSPYNSSLLSPDQDFLKYFTSPERFDVLEQINIEVLQLSEVLEPYAGENIFIKIDAQGISADLVNDCKNNKDIIGFELEISFNNSYKCEKDFSDVHLICKSLGLMLIDLDPTYWKPEAARNLSGMKGMLIYADALYLPDIKTLEQWSKELTKDDQLRKLASIWIICEGYKVYDYFFLALSFFDKLVSENFIEEINKAKKANLISRLLGAKKSMFISSFLRDLADIFQNSNNRFSYTMHNMGNRSRNPKLKILRK
jgi:FkbM family methyltransferase